MRMRTEACFVTRALIISGFVGALASCVVPDQSQQGQTASEERELSSPVQEEAVPDSDYLPGDDLLPTWAAMVRDPSVMGAAFVFIKIISTPGDPAWLLAPNVAGVCRHDKPDCGSTVTWRWLPKLVEGATLRIEGKPDQPPCFEVVELVNPEPVTVEVNPDETQCPAGTIWEYQVSCLPQNLEGCPTLLDPKVHIQD